jgi:hypothetical protein
MEFHMPLEVSSPQPKTLFEFLHGLKPIGIEWRLSPHGALLQHHGRMVAMLLLFGTRLVISPVDGADKHFELDNPDEKAEAIELIKRLRNKTRFVGTTSTRQTKDVIGLTAVL